MKTKLYLIIGIIMTVLLGSNQIAAASTEEYEGVCGFNKFLKMANASMSGNVEILIQL